MDRFLEQVSNLCSKIPPQMTSQFNGFFCIKIKKVAIEASQMYVTETGRPRFADTVLNLFSERLIFSKYYNIFCFIC